ncbi:MAG TPA: RNA methyltransferase [Anaerolineaceae bacterium]|nr:RNA methyltransferase [Anaerolineaceae bacterium]
MSEPVLITSMANPLVKRIRKLRERKERTQSGLFYAEGLRIVAEAVEKPERIETILAAPELLEGSFGRELLARVSASGIPVAYFNPAVFESFALKDGPQGLAALVRQEWMSLNSVSPEPGQSWVILEAVADPGNLGTILRAHDAVGGQGVILLEQSTDPYDPTAIRASMGAVFSQKLIKTTLVEFTAWAQAGGYQIFGTSDAADHDYHYEQYPDPFLLMMGSERHGLSAQAMALCDLMVSIPMLGRGDSLNLAVATAVVLYEWLNHKRDMGGRILK